MPLRLRFSFAARFAVGLFLVLAVPAWHAADAVAGDIARCHASGQQTVTTHEMGNRVHQALTESIDRRQSMHAV